MTKYLITESQNSVLYILRFKPKPGVSYKDKGFCYPISKNNVATLMPMQDFTTLFPSAYVPLRPSPLTHQLYESNNILINSKHHNKINNHYY